ncbi:MAG: tetratricopeptide repeat protein [Myxococcota bacterium]
MRYLCVHCDHRFEQDEDAKPRCPKCMRRHGLEALDEPGGSRRRLPPWAWVGGVVGVLALLGGGYAWWSYATPGAVSGEVPLAPLDRSDVRDWLAHDQVEADEMAGLLMADEAVEAFAEEATADAGGAQKKAKAVVADLAGRAEARTFVPWAMSHPREAPPRTAAGTLSVLGDEGARHKLYPLEVAALTVAALRAVDVPAMVVEGWDFPGDRSPPDPSGHLGYYLVGVWPEGEPDAEKPPVLFDPYGARGDAPSEGGFRVLDDLGAIAAALTHQAAHQLAHQGDTSAALASVEDALALDSRSPQAHTVRGAVLLQTGGPQEGAKEFDAAAELRADGPRRKNLAGLLMAQNKVDEASEEIAAALDQYPDYAGAHALLAAIHLAEGDAERARNDLETAERLDRRLPNLPQVWAQYHLSQGDVDRAVQSAQRAIERRPHDWQTRVHAAQVYRAASKPDAMRREARKVLEMVPSSREPALRRMLEEVLGPTALDEPADDLLAEDDTPSALPEPGELKLGGDDQTGMLDDEGEVGQGGQGLGDEPGDLDLGEDDEPLILGSDPSKLKLRGPDQKLQLEMGD